ncbi:haloacid dehalogenase-like hydrolase [Marilutibacter maris]|uniref:Haloacid dehalogenase n=1 Tax=Marilutibacter maris TaxID=1605891 RepID=A0A2U9T1X4_9GAMM|nr:haloacid dehalogenase-like hydrolase [Lysobacter maris]AWV06391.1 putative phosphoserine phosphatase [Lysobacter maris]KAB8163581.1 haloacid dehalogenase [Lysobacter maris]
MSAVGGDDGVAGRGYPPARADAPLVVFDFDHTLYDGDSGTHLFRWMIGRSWWRVAMAVLIAPLFGPLVAFLPTRRFGISGFVWVGSVFGLHGRRDLDAVIDRYVDGHREQIRARLLPIALEVLHGHRERGDRVVVATGAPPELARAILAFVAHEDVPVVGTRVGPRLGGVGPVRHCHNRMKMTMLHEAGFDGTVHKAYSDSTADLPLLLAAAEPVVVNPKARRVDRFRQLLPAGTPILNWGCPGRAGDPVA